MRYVQPSRGPMHSSMVEAARPGVRRQWDETEVSEAHKVSLLFVLYILHFMQYVL
jgi:hypothetical protein